MFFFTRICIPKFSLTTYEQEIENQLLTKYHTFATQHQYKTLLELQQHIANIANSLHQLKVDPVSLRNIISLENEVAHSVSFLLGDNFLMTYTKKCAKNLPNQKALHNSFMQLENDIKKDNVSKIMSGVFVVTNSIALLAGAGTLILAASMATGTVGLAILALAIGLIGAALLMFAAYSLYVDGRYLFNKQLADIKTGVDFISNFVEIMKNDKAENAATVVIPEAAVASPAPTM